MHNARVLIVGAGPVGLTMANLLGAAGIETVVIERNTTTSDSPKAIGLDAESMRTMQAVGLIEEVRKIVVPGTGTRFYGRKGQLLMHSRGPRPYMFGHAFKNSFAQPDLEKVLLDGARRHPHVSLHFETELIRVENHVSSVSATVLNDGVEETYEFEYIIGCDGGSSPVRKSVGITLTGESHEDVWAVMDVLDDPHPQRYSMHKGIPSRATVTVPGLGTRCRYEFLLRPGEGSAVEPPSLELIKRLLAPYRAIEEHQIERAVNYTFNSLVADEWRRGRVFLAGDAAHMMAPFGGQGLNSGLRDVVNLSWKLIELLEGRATAQILDTYELERKPHATAVVDYSRRLGAIMMTRSSTRAFLRDVAVAALLRFRRSRDHLQQMRFRPPQKLEAGIVVPGRNKVAAARVGSIITQPLVIPGDTLRPTRLDEVIGNGFVLLGIGVSPSDWARIPQSRWPWNITRRHDVVLDDLSPWRPHLVNAFTDADGDLQRDYEAFMGNFLLIRPDRIVAAIFTPAEVDEVIRMLSPYESDGGTPVGSTIETKTENIAERSETLV